MSYELELVAATSDQDYRAAFMATLTGLPKEEIVERIPELLTLKSWGGQRFVEAASKLGYNSNPRFAKFDEASVWPAVLRVQVPSGWGWGKGNWWALIYNQGRVYNPDPLRGWDSMTLVYFKQYFRQCRITSMLQVWLP